MEITKRAPTRHTNTNTTRTNKTGKRDTYLTKDTTKINNDRTKAFHRQTNRKRRPHPTNKKKLTKTSEIQTSKQLSRSQYKGPKNHKNKQKQMAPIIYINIIKKIILEHIKSPYIKLYGYNT